MVEPVTINVRLLARDLGLPQEQVEKAAAFLDEGCPVPFVARYCKGRTDGLDEEKLFQIDAELKEHRMLCERKQAILRTLDSLGKLTPELDKKIREARSAKRLEDLYLPYKAKKQSLAQSARERGLEPLALEILEGKLIAEKVDVRASEFINEDKKVNSVADALLGAGHIVAEIFSERSDVLQQVRDFVYRNGNVVVRKTERQSIGGQSAGAQPKDMLKDAARSGGKGKKKSQGRSLQTGEKLAESEQLQIEAGQSERTPDDTVNVTVEVVAPVIEPASVEGANITSISPEVPLESKSIIIDEDHSGSGGGEETSGEQLSAHMSANLSSVEPTSTNPIVEISKPEAAEPAPVSSLPAVESQTVSDDGAETVTEQFQQWKDAQQEKGIPTVTSQNTLRKKKRAEAKKKKTEAKVRQQEHFERHFSEYFDYSNNIRGLTPQRILTINRGERGKVLNVHLDCDSQSLFDLLRNFCVPAEHPLDNFLAGCLKDAIERLLIPFMERDVRAELTETAEQQTVKNAAKNLRNLLLQPPLQCKRVLALRADGRRSGRLVALDEFGNILGHDLIFLGGGTERKERTGARIADFVQKFKSTIVAIGGGPGSGELEEIVSATIAKHFSDSELSYVVVNDIGANHYASSSAGKEEFPEYDPMLREVISIGRRLLNPIIELTKIDPAHLAVGMHPGDVRGKLLSATLTSVIQSAVNRVGVDLNQATPLLLCYVAGLNQLTAKRIYDYRKDKGPFQSRDELKNVPGLSESAFNNAAGFLKIVGGKNPLDATWIHPTQYDVATKILAKLGFVPSDLRDPEKVKQIAAKIRDGKISVLSSQFADEFSTDVFSTRLILDNLSWPGRDPRDLQPKPIFRKSVLHIKDLAPGVELSGTVLNVVEFGAFVDIGLPESGLIHISHMSDRYIKDAYDKVAVGDVVRVWVLEADAGRRRISLSMLPPGAEKQPRHERGPRRHGTESGESQHQTTEREQRRRPDGRPPRKEGEQRRTGRGRDAGGRDGRNNRSRERDDRNRGPKTYIAAPKEKTVKPISEDMKKGKEPLRSFGDLAQLLGRVQVPDPKEEKRLKKEGERQRREQEQKTEPQSETKPGDISESISKEQAEG